MVILDQSNMPTCDTELVSVCVTCIRVWIRLTENSTVAKVIHITNRIQGERQSATQTNQLKNRSSLP